MATSLEALLLTCATVYMLLWVLVIYLWVRRNPAVVLSPTNPEHLANHLYWQFTARGWKTQVRRAFPEMVVRVEKGGFTAAHLYIRPVSPSDPRLEITHRPAATTIMVVLAVILFGAVFPLAIMMAAPFSSAKFVRSEVIPFVLFLVDPRRPPVAFSVPGAVYAVPATPVAPVAVAAPAPLPPVYQGPPRDPMEAFAREQIARDAAARGAVPPPSAPPPPPPARGPLPPRPPGR